MLAIALLQLLPVLLVPAVAAATSMPAHVAANRFGMGVYNDTSGPDIALQLPEAAALVGDGGTVLLYFELKFSKTGEPGSCLGGCLPAEWQANAVRQAYALNLQPIVRVDQWSRRIRDFADKSSSSSPHQNYTRLAQAYRTFFQALPLPPDGKTPLKVQLLNELNGCVWECAEQRPGSFLPAKTAAAEVAGCLRDLMRALRTLPRLSLAIMPLAQVGFSRCECTPPYKPIVRQNTSQLSFASQMLDAVPELYDDVDFIIVHAYPQHEQSFDTPAGRNGIISYQALTRLIQAHRQRAGPAKSLPVVIGETGWHCANKTRQAHSFIAALQQVFFEDPDVVAVVPYLLAGFEALNAPKVWVQWQAGDTKPTSRDPEWLSTQALRCRQNVGGRKGC